MSDDLKWKRNIDYYAFKSMSLERRLADVEFDRDRLRAAVEVLSRKKSKKYSRFFVVFKQDDEGLYYDPIIVTADSPEEALCPEGADEPRGHFCHLLYDASEYSEI